MKKKTRIENERNIVSRVKSEMDRPRLTEAGQQRIQRTGSTDRGETCCPIRASVNPDPLSTTFNSNLLDSAHALAASGRLRSTSCSGRSRNSLGVSLGEFFL
jgi:hypothetical protein